MTDSNPNLRFNRFVDILLIRYIAEHYRGNELVDMREWARRWSESLVRHPA
jgi:hypothetical protein